jgi:thiazole synthase ThiGH ThiG subunit
MIVPNEESFPREVLAPADQTWTIGGRTLTSRLIVGTGGAQSIDLLRKVLAASGTQLTTVAMRRVTAAGEGSLLGMIRQAGVDLLPNTAGCHTATEAARRSAPTGSSSKSSPTTSRCCRTPRS